MPALAHAATLGRRRLLAGVHPARVRWRLPDRAASSSASPRRHASRARGARRAVVARLGDFAEIDAESQDAPGGVAEGRFGPDAILLVGFTPAETCKWRAELDAIEADFVRLVTCTKDMVDGPLGVALETEQEDPAAETSAFGVERMMFFSGMVGGEIVQLVDLFNGLGWPPSGAAACAVPNNWDSSVRELIDEIADDHKVMMDGARSSRRWASPRRGVNRAASRWNTTRRRFFDENEPRQRTEPPDPRTPTVVRHHRRPPFFLPPPPPPTPFAQSPR